VIVIKCGIHTPVNLEDEHPQLIVVVDEEEEEE